MSLEDAYDMFFLKIGWKYVLLLIWECIAQLLVQALRILLSFELYLIM